MIKIYCTIRCLTAVKKDDMDQAPLILVVDDDPHTLLGTTRIIEKAGYRVIKATDGKECLEKTKSDKPDLILLDVVLPDIDGTEVCKQIKTDPDLKNTFIVLFSGMRTTSDEQAEGLDTGADGYIARPISNRELTARVNAMVRILKAERERDNAIRDLQDALNKIKRLSGLLPICSYCKKIRDSKGYWNQLEAYIRDHSEAEFSHSICEECFEEQMPKIENSNS